MQDVLLQLWKVMLPLLRWVPLFLTGFLISRMFAKDGLAEQFLRQLLQKSEGRFPLVLLAIVGAAAFLSLFIPNVLTVLTLLAVIEKLRQALADAPEEDTHQLVTPLGLALIYGANIGGMGSMVGSPANALMLFWLSFLKVPGREQIDFLSWLMWGIPLVVVFCLIAWGLLVLFFVPKKFYQLKLSLEDEEEHRLSINHRKMSSRLAIFSAFFWIGIELLRSMAPGYLGLWEGLSVLFCVSFVGIVFFQKIEQPDGLLRPVLRWGDCFSGLPWRGVFLAGAAGLVGGFLFWIGMPGWLALQVKAMLPAQMTPFLFYLTFALITIFATELMSNTAVSVAMFPVVYQLAISMKMEPLPAMIAVALASTCAFMSPLATPATGLAFGEMRGLSLKRMFALGLLVNLIGGFWLTWYLTRVLPWFYPL